ncbi:MAG: hypothetical protein CVV64_07780 [Candidatus Wallbacteria bacterium HGW-Wallbacteria-1]|jgi:hypothetical protein|uniref:Uncharacterized protein n=1 Tax=Candidatus Wallbacteria bacterium HGW-Wallbacteria-1 TaxID=2013854 RepID=A0A2N1PQZ9_9BACT|nr:MAG: hypothetical protein CVV64_07780 [Candidatus Wallbacteria bacterium HGW-Wallbacteria-1]
MNRLRYYFLATFVIFAIAGCLGKGTTTFPTDADTLGTADKMTVTPAGGNIVFRKTGLSLTLEKGDVQTTSDVLLVAYSPSGYSGQPLASTVTPVSDFYQFSGITPAPGKSVRVTVPYDKTKVTTASAKTAAASSKVMSLGVTTASDIDLYSLSSAGIWTRITNGKTISTTSGTLSALVTSLNRIVIASSTGTTQGTTTSLGIAD